MTYSPRAPRGRVATEEQSVVFDSDDDVTKFRVVMNHEGQYSIWPSDREPPLGWQEVGVSGAKVDCLKYIRETWTDMRPASLRRAMGD
jgi:MbtH protein